MPRLPALPSPQVGHFGHRLLNQAVTPHVKKPRDAQAASVVIRAYFAPLLQPAPQNMPSLYKSQHRAGAHGFPGDTVSSSATQGILCLITAVHKRLDRVRHNGRLLSVLASRCNAGLHGSVASMRRLRRSDVTGAVAGLLCVMG